MLKVAILGGTGYTGKYLIQFCNNHPFIDIMHIYANTTAGENLYNIFPELIGGIENQTIKSITTVSADYDAYFIALPHGTSVEIISKLLSYDKLVIDLGGDYRLDSNKLCKEWYGFSHTNEALLQSKIYGLAEFADYSSGTKLIANPGCYPTAALLSLIPIIKYFEMEIISISVNAYSGTSGAGKKADANLLLSEMDGNVKAYNVNKHRHEPEIYQELSKEGKINSFSFTTHLLPISRGIYSTASIHFNKLVKAENIMDTYLDAYSKSQFVRIRENPPSLSWVINTNYCDISISVKENVLIVNAAIDNLIKGAAGQAFQNLNKYFGWDESLGIKTNLLAINNY